jgi:hypothetical protein
MLLYYYITILPITGNARGRLLSRCLRGVPQDFAKHHMCNGQGMTHTYTLFKPTPSMSVYDTYLLNPPIYMTLTY